jgi:hypothetical protein
MTDSRMIAPVDGRKVRFPGTGQVLTEPTPVVWGSYWERLLQAGDVVVDAPDAAIAPQPMPPPPPPPAGPAAETKKVS